MSNFDSYPTPDDYFFSLEEQWQRDFIWALHGPALVDCRWAPRETPSLTFDIEASYELVKKGAPEFLNKGSRRLGHYFERLWKVFWESQGFRYRGGQQIYDGGRTLGELDVLCEINKTQFHFELAVKYYLQFNTLWYGPQSHDRLDMKLAHLQAHQLKLSEHPIALKQLEALDWNPTERLAILRGCLFHAVPEYAQSQQMGCLEFLRTSYWQGMWCYQEDWQEFLTAKQWLVIGKPLWLSPAKSATALEHHELHQIIDSHFQQTEFPICLCEMKQGPYGFVEQKRWFVVSSSWPNQEDSAR